MNYFVYKKMPSFQPELVVRQYYCTLILPTVHSLSRGTKNKQFSNNKLQNNCQNVTPQLLESTSF